MEELPAPVTPHWRTACTMSPLSGDSDGKMKMSWLSFVCGKGGTVQEATVSPVKGWVLVVVAQEVATHPPHGGAEVLGAIGDGTLAPERGGEHMT
jgi:hypothetical protein